MGGSESLARCLCASKESELDAQVDQGQGQVDKYLWIASWNLHLYQD